MSVRIKPGRATQPASRDSNVWARRSTVHLDWARRTVNVATLPRTHSSLNFLTTTVSLAPATAAKHGTRLHPRRRRDSATLPDTWLGGRVPTAWIWRPAQTTLGTGKARKHPHLHESRGCHPDRSFHQSSVLHSHRLLLRLAAGAQYLVVRLAAIMLARHWSPLIVTSASGVATASGTPSSEVGQVVILNIEVRQALQCAVNRPVRKNAMCDDNVVAHAHLGVSAVAGPRQRHATHGSIVAMLAECFGRRCDTPEIVSSLPHAALGSLPRTSGPIALGALTSTRLAYGGKFMLAPAQSITNRLGE
ncbi:hypothetical protein EK21DRAFT_93116 [Setomelanomma holmii]|uniref:Uncharacterized protein n=1 Tax=Setomelanomma holmii TaxID=210430 RepID=A0A9P4LHU7_9PLEO|nr:hypothetical protein EK21DRAFT_93116 [Setomelanomma holmii]